MEYFSVTDVSKLLKISRYTLRLWLREGKIKGTKIGGDTWRISSDDLNEFIEEGKNHANSSGNAQKS